MATHTCETLGCANGDSFKPPVPHVIKKSVAMAEKIARLTSICKDDRPYAEGCKKNIATRAEPMSPRENCGGGSQRCKC